MNAVDLRTRAAGLVERHAARLGFDQFASAALVCAILSLDAELPGGAPGENGLRALRWLLDHGGEGVLDRYGALIAQGERYLGAGAAQTWLQLFTTAHVAGAGKNRIALTDEGRALAERQPRLAPSVDAIPDQFERHGSADPMGEYADGEVGYVR